MNKLDSVIIAVGHLSSSCLLLSRSNTPRRAKFTRSLRSFSRIGSVTLNSKERKCIQENRFYLPLLVVKEECHQFY